MGKMKVHELAKELGMQSKELVDKLVELKYNIKSHLSTLEDSDVEKIRKTLGGKKSNNASNDDKSVSPKKEKKPIAPVIIRREVTRVVETTREDTRSIEPSATRDGLGVVQRRTDTSMNIKYRTPPRKIGSITPNANNEIKDEVKEETPVKPKLEVVEKKDVGTEKQDTVIQTEVKKTVEIPEKKEVKPSVTENDSNKIEKSAESEAQPREVNDNTPKQGFARNDNNQRQNYNNRNNDGRNGYQNRNNDYQRPNYNRNDNSSQGYNRNNDGQRPGFNRNNDRNQGDGNNRNYRTYIRKMSRMWWRFSI